MAYKDSYVYECNMIAVAVSSQLLCFSQPRSWPLKTVPKQAGILTN
jgi:hypothetical protein